MAELKSIFGTDAHIILGGGVVFHEPPGYVFDYHGLEEMASIPIVTPNRITGEGRMKVRGRDKAEANIHKKRKKARKISKQSRRRNRHG